MTCCFTDHTIFLAGLFLQFGLPCSPRPNGIYLSHDLIVLTRSRHHYPCSIFPWKIKFPMVILQSACATRCRSRLCHLGYLVLQAGHTHTLMQCYKSNIAVQYVLGTVRKTWLHLLFLHQRIESTHGLSPADSLLNQTQGKSSKSVGNHIDFDLLLSQLLAEHQVIIHAPYKSGGNPCEYAADAIASHKPSHRPLMKPREPFVRYCSLIIQIQNHPRGAEMPRLARLMCSDHLRYELVVLDQC